MQINHSVLGVVSYFKIQHFHKGMIQNWNRIFMVSFDNI